METQYTLTENGNAIFIGDWGSCEALMKQRATQDRMAIIKRQEHEFTELEQELLRIAEKTVAEYKRPRVVSESEDRQIAELRAQNPGMPEELVTIVIPTYREYGMARGLAIVKIPKSHYQNHF